MAASFIYPNFLIVAPSSGVQGFIVGHACGGTGYAFVYSGDPAGSSDPITFEILSGALPTGCTLHTSGAIFGTPTTAGNFTVTVKATQAADSAEATFTFSVAAAADGAEQISTQGNFPLTGAAGLPIVFSLGYTGTPVTWSAPGGLPAWLQIYDSPPDTVLGGTPPAAGVYQFTLLATGPSDFQHVDCILVVTPGQNYVMMIPPAFVATPYSFTFNQAFGDSVYAGDGLAPAAPYTFAITFNVPPAGLTATGGTISGTATAIDFSFPTRVEVSGTSGGPIEADLNFFVFAASPPALLTAAIYGTFVGSGGGGQIGGTK